jgi:hypothetical protein
MALACPTPACSRDDSRTLVITIPMRLERQGGRADMDGGAARRRASLNSS